MARILKFIRAETGDVTRFDRDCFEEFPDIPEETYPGEPVAETEEEAPLDPDAIREAIMAAARADAECKVKEAYQEGLDRGMETGRQRFDASLARCADALNAAAKAIETSHAEFLGQLEPQVIALLKLAVTRVIGAEMRGNPDLLQHTVRRALEKLSGQYAVTLLLHPDDLEAIRKHEITLLDSVPGIQTLEIVASDAVEPGGCIARSDFMEVDARLETLLGQVLDALTE